MMLPKIEYGKNSGEDSSSGRLLHDIEEISRALYLHKAPSKALISSPDHQSKSAGKMCASDSKLKDLNEDLLHNNKKSSIWNWKPLKALTHIRNHRFNCCFFLHVHTIEGLPLAFNDLALCVTWKRKDEVLRTHPARVCKGIAEFDETLMHRCTVYGSRNGPHHSAKYDAKLFLLNASVIGAPGLDIGKHLIDLTRLLPLTLEELAEDKRSSGKWTTSFNLTGKAKGALLNVSFGFCVLGDNVLNSNSYLEDTELLKGTWLSPTYNLATLDQTDETHKLQRLGSVPNKLNYRSYSTAQSLDIQHFDKIFPNQHLGLGPSIAFLYQKLDAGNLGNSEEPGFCCGHLQHLKPNTVSMSEASSENIDTVCHGTESTVIEKGVELSEKEQAQLQESYVETYDDSAVETIDVAEIFKDDEIYLERDLNCNAPGDLEDKVRLTHRWCPEGTDTAGPTIEEFESVFHILSKSGELDSFSMGTRIEHDDHMKTKTGHKTVKMVKSLSLDDVTESVANDFLNMLDVEQGPLDSGYDTEPESPRERLLRQFEKDALESGNSIIDFDVTSERVEFGYPVPTDGRWETYSGNVDLPVGIRAAEDFTSLRKSLRNRRNASMLENLEAEALMQEWGLNERAFVNSPRTSSGAFGSPVYLPSEELPELPPLGEGLAPIIRTMDGGFLRSMNLSLFKNANNGGSLIMQVSGPIVLPTAMGSSIIDILQRWALVGVENMSMGINKLLPLDDITGKTIQQVAREAASGINMHGRGPLLLHASDDGSASFGMREKLEALPYARFSEKICPRSADGEMESNYVSSEDLAPLAMDKIEDLCIEGLRIQSNMSNEEAPSSIRLQCNGKTFASTGEDVNLDKFIGFRSADGSQQLDAENCCAGVEKLISLSVSLDEWMRLDSGDFGDEDDFSGRTSEILVAHGAKYTDGMSGKLSGRGRVCLGYNLTLALKVQLRDPSRNYETVGCSMLALVQVERKLDTLTAEECSMLSLRTSDGEADNMHKQLVSEEINAVGKESKIREESSSMFKISEVHIAGFKTEPDKQLWGTRMQQQSGARWLLSSGMGKTQKLSNWKSSALVKVKPSLQMTRKGKHEDILWSISSHVHETRSNWKELAMLNLYVRNPDITFPNESIRFS